MNLIQKLTKELQDCTSDYEQMKEERDALKQLVFEYRLLVKNLVNQRTEEWQANRRDLYERACDLLGEEPIK